MKVYCVVVSEELGASGAEIKFCEVYESIEESRDAMEDIYEDYVSRSRQIINEDKNINNILLQSRYTRDDITTEIKIEIHESELK